MSIKDKIDEAATLLQKVKKFDDLMLGNSFTDATVIDMKQSAKDVCDEAKGDIDDIKSEIDGWS